MKSLLQALLIAVLGSAIGGLIVLRVQTPADIQIEVAANWVEVPTGHFGYDPAELKKIEPSIAKIFGTDTIPVWLDGARFRGSIVLFEIEVYNADNQRSKDIDVAVRDAFMALVQRREGSSRKVTLVKQDSLSAIPLGPLPPGDKVTVLVLSNSLSSFADEGTIRVLHDGRRLAVDRAKPRSYPEALGIARLASRNVLFEFLIAVSIFISVLTLALVAFGISIRNNWPLLAKLNSKDDLRRMIRLLDYVRTHHPERLAGIENSGASASNAESALIGGRDNGSDT